MSNSSAAKDLCSHCVNDKFTLGHTVVCLFPRIVRRENKTHEHVENTILFTPLQCLIHDERLVLSIILQICYKKLKVQPNLSIYIQLYIILTGSCAIFEIKAYSFTWNEFYNRSDYCERTPLNELFRWKGFTEAIFITGTFKAYEVNEH